MHVNLRPISSLVSISLLALACGSSSQSAPNGMTSSQDPDASDAPSFVGDGGNGGDATDAGFCAGKGPIPVGTHGDCTGDVAMKLFPFAACSCTTLSVSGTFTTSSFDSKADGGTADVASVAANERLSVNATSQIGGSVYAAASGANVVSLGNTGHISRFLESNGAVDVNGGYVVGKDLVSLGDVSASGGGLTVDGNARMGAGRTLSGVTVKGSTTYSAAPAPAPCDCSNPVAISSLVAGYVNVNDDAMAGVTPSSLDAPTATVTLPCGHYYFSALHGDDLKLNVTGRAAIFVGGDVDASLLTINLSADAEVDLFVSGNFSLTGNVAFGSTSAPSRVRLYVDGPIFDLSGNVEVGANMYAPNADVAVSSNFKMAGAIFAHRLAFSGNFDIAYDAAIIDTPGCKPPGGGCKSCHDCNGSTPACKGGTCGACTSDSDCCAPLQCSSGKCVFNPN